MTDFKRFHNELKAAIVARVPIEIGGQNLVGSSGCLTMAKLDRLESVMQPLLTGDQPLKQVLDTQPELPSRYRAALRVFDQTESMVPVLDGLTTRRLAQRRITRILRWTFFYLMLVLLIAFLGLRFFDSAIVPVVHDMRADMLLPAAINAPERIDPLPWMPVIVAVLGVGFVITSIWLLIGGASKAALWLGGNHYVRCRTSTTTIQTLQMLMATGMDVDEAVSISCDLSGAETTTCREIQIAAKDLKKSGQLDSLCDYFTILASQRLAYMKVGTPIALISTVGGGVVVLYAVLIFWPIISMIKDLATAGL